MPLATISHIGPCQPIFLKTNINRTIEIHPQGKGGVYDIEIFNAGVSSHIAPPSSPISLGQEVADCIEKISNGLKNGELLTYIGMYGEELITKSELEYYLLLKKIILTVELI